MTYWNPGVLKLTLRHPDFMQLTEKISQTSHEDMGECGNTGFFTS